MPSESNQGYDTNTIILHWATALLVAVLWIIGQTADWIVDRPLNNACWSTHVVLGFMLTLLLGIRIWWRVFHGRRLPPADRGMIGTLAKATHYALYILLITVVLLGIINAFVRGYSLFGLSSLPQLGDRAWRRPLTHWHGLVGPSIALIPEAIVEIYTCTYWCR